MSARGFQRTTSNYITVLPDSCSYCTAIQYPHIAGIKERPLLIWFYSDCFCTQKKALSIFSFFFFSSSCILAHFTVFLTDHKNARRNRNESFLNHFLNSFKFNKFRTECCISEQFWYPHFSIMFPHWMLPPRAEEHVPFVHVVAVSAIVNRGI